MKIGLLDVDGHNFPNLALMKLSAFHKKQGDKVEWLFPMGKYGRIYKAKVFDFTEDFDTCINSKEIIKGGTGYSLQGELPDEIENIYPDYSLYGIKNVAYGFLTRGCPRGCPFCIVGKKEGKKSYKATDLERFWKGQKEIKLLDPNLLACKDKENLLKQLIESRAWVDFTQGLDIRLMTSDIANMLNKIKIKEIHFAWDDMRQSNEIIKRLKLYAEHAERKPHGFYGSVYVLTNFNTTMEENLYRIYKLRELGYDPYVMIFDKYNAPREIRLLQRWVNNKIIFRSGNAETFEEYNEKIG